MKDIGIKRMLFIIALSAAVGIGLAFLFLVVDFRQIPISHEFAIALVILINSSVCSFYLAKKISSRILCFILAGITTFVANYVASFLIVVLIVFPGWPDF